MERARTAARAVEGGQEVRMVAAGTVAVLLAALEGGAGAAGPEGLVVAAAARGRAAEVARR